MGLVAGVMRYLAAGGMNAAARARREAVRTRAVGMFADSWPTSRIAGELRVSEKSVREWRRRWTAGGAGRVGIGRARRADCKLSDEQQKHLAGMPDEGPVVHGWVDARWEPRTGFGIDGQSANVTRGSRSC
jgi:putative transposase